MVKKMAFGHGMMLKVKKQMNKLTKTELFPDISAFKKNHFIKISLPINCAGIFFA
jgi:hypothetical protein